MQWKNRGISFDCIPEYSCTIDNLSEGLFKNFLKQRKIGFKSKQIPFELFESYKVATSEQQGLVPTKGGLLLFSKSVQSVFSEAFIICTHFKGTSGRDAISSIDATGTLFEQFNIAWEFIVSKIPVSWKIVGKKRIEEPEIPLDAVREALVNAIIHRDYRIQAPIKIAIYRDRVEIFSPGTFPGPISISQIGNGVTYIRNNMIAKCFREVGLVEKLGSGFRTIFDLYLKANLLDPIVYEGDGFVKVVLPREEKSCNHCNLYSGSEGDVKITTNYDNDELIKIIRMLENATVSEILKYATYSRATLGRKLKMLVDTKRIKKIGSGPATKYCVYPSVQ